MIRKPIFTGYKGTGFDECLNRRLLIVSNSLPLSKNNKYKNDSLNESLKTTGNFEHIEYQLDNYNRSNQDTCLQHRPSVAEGQWVQSGDLLADCAASSGGELALGQNLLIAYMPWEGYNFEDAILISERLVYDDLYTSIHIEKYEIESKETKLGFEEITRNIPDISENYIKHLDSNGIARIGSYVEEGDILVGKITPINKKGQSPYQKLLYTILEKEFLPFRDSSLRAPKGIRAKVIKVTVSPEGSLITPSSPNVPSAKNINSHINKDSIYPKIKKSLLPLNKKMKNIKSSLLRLKKNLSIFASPMLSLPKAQPSNVKSSYNLVEPSSSINKKPLLISSFRATKNHSNELTDSNFNNSNTRTANAYAHIELGGTFVKKTEFITKKILTYVQKKSLLTTLQNYNFDQKNLGCNSITRGLNPTFKTKIEIQQILETQKPFYRKNYKIKRSNVKNTNSGIGNVSSSTNTRAVPTFFINNKKLYSAHLSQHLEFNTRGTYGELEFSKKNLNLKLNGLIYYYLSNKKLSSLSAANINALGLNKQRKLQNIIGTVHSKRLPKINSRTSVANVFVPANAPTGGLDSALSVRKVPTNLRKSALTQTLTHKAPLNSVKAAITVQLYLAIKRKVQVGDKLSGRHGNKGIISQILPREDMPFLPDGTPLDMVLNPLGVPSRMNVGQIYECLLGLAGKYLGENFKVFPFDEIYGPEASRSFVYSKLYDARLKTGFDWLFNPNTPGKIRLYDGRTGDCFDQAITVGKAYILRLVHMVDDKIHMRSTGPYSLVTQQPLRGRSKQGGQRLGEMEVWALEGYGAAFTLLEMLTIKSDDMTGRMTLWSNLILNKEINIGTPESFKVLVCELQALCLDIGLFRFSNQFTTAKGLKQTINQGEYSNSVEQYKNIEYGKPLIEIENLMNLP